MMEGDAKRLFRDALDREEAGLAEAHGALAKAQIEFDVASRKYAALRDLFAEKFVEPPYSVGSMTLSSTRGGSRGRYRFIHMVASDAIIAALMESEEPLSLGALYRLLETGGWALETGGPSLRSINAALMKTTGVTKTDDDRYVLANTSVPAKERGKNRESQTA